MNKTELSLDKTLVALLKQSTKPDQTPRIKRLEARLAKGNVELRELRKLRKYHQESEDLSLKREQLKKDARRVAADAGKVIRLIGQLEKRQLGSFYSRTLSYSGTSTLSAAKRRLLATLKTV